MALSKSESICWPLFVVFLMYASGVPILIASLLQQASLLPPLSNSLFWSVLFPLGGSANFNSTGDGDDGDDNAVDNVDLSAPNYLVLAIPFFVASLVMEAVMIHFVLPPSKRPFHKPRLNDAMTSISLGILNLLVTLVLFVSYTQPVYDYIYDNFKLTNAFDSSNSLG